MRPLRRSYVWLCKLSENDPILYLKDSFLDRPNCFALGRSRCCCCCRTTKNKRVSLFSHCTTHHVQSAPQNEVKSSLQQRMTFDDKAQRTDRRSGVDDTHYGKPNPPLADDLTGPKTAASVIGSWPVNGQRPLHGNGKASIRSCSDLVRDWHWLAVWNLPPCNLLRQQTLHTYVRAQRRIQVLPNVPP